MRASMKFAKLIILFVWISCTPTQETAKHVSPVEVVTPTTAVPTQQQVAAQSYEECFEYCVSAMDQAGQVTDECPRQCREDTNSYTEDDLMDDDQNMGLMVSEQCLKQCQKNSADIKAGGGCKQRCCVSSCELRQEYNGSGMGPACPKMCREFLKRRLESPSPTVPAQ